MSKVAIKGAASGTATFTIESPSTNTDRVLVLPDVAGTVALTSQIPAAYTDTDALDLFNASGSAPVFACRAFVNFNGTGTVAIRASGNVSSITDNSVGSYTVNFTTAMPDANYSTALASPIASSGDLGLNLNALNTTTTTSCTVVYQQSDGSGRDVDLLSFSVFR